MMKYTYIYMSSFTHFPDIYSQKKDFISELNVPSGSLEPQQYKGSKKVLELSDKRHLLINA